MVSASFRHDGSAAFGSAPDGLRQIARFFEYVNASGNRCAAAARCRREVRGLAPATADLAKIEAPSLDRA
jgi:hypothetical protein